MSVVESTAGEEAHEMLIYEAYLSCINLFASCKACLSLSKISQQRLDDEMLRFHIWASNIGSSLDSSMTSSLDHRLRNSTTTRNAIIMLLRVLRANLDYTTRIFDQSEDTLYEIAAIDNAKAECGEAHETASPMGAGDVAKSLSDEAIASVHNIITQLKRMSAAIKRATAAEYNIQEIKKRDIKGDTDEGAADEIFATNLVKYRFPGEAEEETEIDAIASSEDLRDPPLTIQEILINAMSFRMRRFRHWKQHHEKLSRRKRRIARSQAITSDYPLLPEEGPETAEPQHLGAQTSSNEHTSIERPELPEAAASSRMSFESTLYETPGSVVSRYTNASMSVRSRFGPTYVAWPRPPRKPSNSDDNDDVTCPYCFEKLEPDELKKTKWRKHVKKDLQPYSCLNEECQTYLKMFPTEEQWSSHMKTRHMRGTWVCRMKPHQEAESFSDEDQVRDHLEQKHKGMYPRSLTETVIKSMYRPADGYFFDECPMKCQDQPPSSEPDRLAHHIATHLLSLAMEALPERSVASSQSHFPDDDDWEEDETASSSTRETMRSGTHMLPAINFTTDVEIEGIPRDGMPKTQAIPNAHDMVNEWVELLLFEDSIFCPTDDNADILRTGYIKPLFDLLQAVLTNFLAIIQSQLDEINKAASSTSSPQLRANMNELYKEMSKAGAKIPRLVEILSHAMSSNRKYHIHHLLRRVRELLASLEDSVLPEVLAQQAEVSYLASNHASSCFPRLASLLKSEGRFDANKIRIPIDMSKLSRCIRKVVTFNHLDETNFFLSDQGIIKDLVMEALEESDDLKLREPSQLMPASAKLLLMHRQIENLLKDIGHSLAQNSLNSRLANFVRQDATRLFLMLIYVDKLEMLEKFYDQGIGDSMFPLKVKLHRTHAIIEGSKPAKLEFATQMKFEEADILFNHQQWLFFAPKLIWATFDDALIHPRCRLPFLREPTRLSHTEFSTVSSTVIHRDYVTIDIDGIETHTDSDGNPFVIVVKLFATGLKNELFKSSVEAQYSILDKLRGFETRHLLKAAAFYRQDENAYFIFPSPQHGNLREFWSGELPQIDHRGYMNWVFDQLLGLADAIEALHHANGSRMCCHGDLQPENILCFHSKTSPKAVKDHTSCILVISAVGLSRIHEEPILLRLGKNMPVGKALSYAPPETELYPVMDPSRRNDIWPLGCLYLEFVIWLLHGPQGLELFEREINSRFYTTNRPYGLSPSSSTAMINPGVNNWIENIIKKDPRCAPIGTKETAMFRLINLVKERLLVTARDPNPRDLVSIPAQYREENQDAVSQYQQRLNIPQLNNDAATTTSLNDLENTDNRHASGSADAGKYERAYASEVRRKLAGIIQDVKNGSIDWINFDQSAANLAPCLEVEAVTGRTILSVKRAHGAE